MLSAPAVFQTTRVQTETETAKWPGKPQDLDDYQVIPEVVHTVRLLFTDVVSFFLSGRHLFSGQGRQWYNQSHNYKFSLLLKLNLHLYSRLMR